MKYGFLSEIVHLRAKESGEKEALKIRNKQTKTWTCVSWKTFSDKIRHTACALYRYGIKPQDRVGVYTQNFAECFYIDFAIFSNRAISVPMYATSSIPQISYIINETEISILFVGEQLQYDNARVVQKNSHFLKQLVLIDKTIRKSKNDTTSLYFDEFINEDLVSNEELEQIEERSSKIEDSDVVHIIYTSGTTGEPKGVMLTQGNYLTVLKTHDLRLHYLPGGFVSMCFLPLTHIFEKAWSILCLHWGCVLAINSDPKEIRLTMKEISPEAMCSVPRFWEKVYSGVQEKIGNLNFILKWAFNDAVATGRRHNLDYRNKGRKAPWWIRQKFRFYDHTIFNLIKKEIGIEKGLIYPCAGAALSDEINIFMQSINIPLIYGYGLTETTATVCCFPQTGFKIGTIGKVMPEQEVRIGENNEIQVKGGNITTGYYRNPKETINAFTEDGWFRTGDAGSLSENNELTIKERIKDLYKTANGKYIAPQQLETRLSGDKYIDTAAIIGDQRKYVTALIIPDFDELEKYAEKHLITYDSIEELCNNQLIYALFKLRIDSMQNEFANYEQIKKFYILSEPFSIESGELTDTLKIKRSFIEKKYKDIIDSLY
ncbi:MAG: long-chain fatty acid--CoA ligase [Dysgonamonadaceae bacterium]|jgi:long-chain acyl-CoA synthetase|nr:long-chain fatty acid--CoA ligase [Dysgonamonadaceae bacterium]